MSQPQPPAQYGHQPQYGQPMPYHPPAPPAPPVQHTQPVAYPPVVPMPYPPQVLPPQGYPVPPAGYMPMHVGHASQVQQVRQVGMSVTRPAWSLGEIMIVVITCGLAWPLVWLARRGKTTYTTHR